jgi:hypothetical protein
LEAKRERAHWALISSVDDQEYCGVTGEMACACACAAWAAWAERTRHFCESELLLRILIWIGGSHHGTLQARGQSLFLRANCRWKRAPVPDDCATGWQPANAYWSWALVKATAPLDKGKTYSSLTGFVAVLEPRSQQSVNIGMTKPSPGKKLKLKSYFSRVNFVTDPLPGPVPVLEIRNFDQKTGDNGDNGNLGRPSALPAIPEIVIKHSIIQLALLIQLTPIPGKTGKNLISRSRCLKINENPGEIPITGSPGDGLVIPKSTAHCKVETKGAGFGTYNLIFDSLVILSELQHRH